RMPIMRQAGCTASEGSPKAASQKPGLLTPSAEQAGRGGRLLLAGVDQFAEDCPALAVELGELLLLDGGKVCRARVDLDPRQEERQLDVLDVRRLLHDVLPREIVAALLQDLRHQDRHV